MIRYFITIFTVSAAILGASVLARSQSAIPVRSTKKQQTSAALPAGIDGWAGEDSSKILDDPVIKSRLKKLMGKTGYASFMGSFETLTPITKDGNVLFASGCLIHACTHLESAIAIDLSTRTIHAATYNEEKGTRFYNERGTKPPKPVIAWAKKLSDKKGDRP